MSDSVDKLELLLAAFENEGKREEKTTRRVSDETKDERFEWCMNNPSEAWRLFHQLACDELTKRQFIHKRANAINGDEDWVLL